MSDWAGCALLKGSYSRELRASDPACAVLPSRALVLYRIAPPPHQEARFFLINTTCHVGSRGL